MPCKKHSIALALCCVLLLGFIATSIISYFTAQHQLNTQIAEETLPLTGDNIYSEIEQDLLRSVLISSLMAHDTFLRDWPLDGERDREAILRYLRQIQDKYATTTAFFVSERTRHYYHPKGTLATVEANDPKDAWYFRVSAMDEPYEINVDADTADRSRLTIFVNYRVTDGNGRFLGATGIGHSVQSVAGLIERYERRYGRDIFFTDDAGEITLHGEALSGPGNIRERPGLQKVATRLLSSPSVQTHYAHPDGRTVNVNSRLIPELGWHLIVQNAKSAAQKRILDTLILNVGIATALALLVGLTGWLTVRGYQGRLEEMASTDKLTGGSSRQVFDTIFDHVARSARRHRNPVSLLAIDIDGFKPINDEHGHAAGDEVLRTLGEVLRARLRETDTLCRWGGDEFIALMPHCEIDNAQDVAEGIRAAVAERTIVHAGTALRVTVSIGVAQYRPGENLPSLVARADAALYESKRQGRNRVAVC